MITEILILSLFFLFVINTPIAVAIGTASLVAIAVQGDFSLMVVIQRMVAGTDSFHLMAVPLFMYAGTIMEKGGMSQRLIDFANALTGWLPGGLAAVSIVSAMFFAGISGSAAADAAAVGAILIPAMKRSGYPSDFSAAVQAAGGSLGVVIPPSIPMIIYGFLTGASISRLFAAGILPGLLIAVSLISVATFISWKNGFAPENKFSWQRLGVTAKDALLALGAPVIILGGILSGVFTATESAAVAVVYALLVSMAVYRQIRFKDLFQIFGQAGITSAIVMFIISTAYVFSWIAAIEQIPEALAGGLLSMTKNPVYLLLLINLVLLITGVFVETTASLILLVPMITAMVPNLGIDPVQLGVIVVANLAIGMLTPPMGICLIVSSSISGQSIGAVSRCVVPFLLVLIVDLILISFYPPLTMWLARILGP
ncbi:TRAP transporter large permease [uncultured Desulfobacter sp.]|uniref:TRAP transporter large permease n=1 Tax=uncultured Desulfobacter sp. TaxID=240139 RepID=UPI002AA919EA|nr:TRAP transporter large permease [uncultured Desulfobacter sp.]